MKVLFPFVGDSVGGSHKSTIALIQSLISHGVDVKILLHKGDGQLSDYLNLHNLKFEILPARYLAGESPSPFGVLFGVLINFYKIYSYIYRNKITVVHANDLRIILTWAIVVKCTKSKFIWHQRTLLSPSYYWRLINYLADHLVAISEVVYSTVPPNIPAHKKHLIYNPINTEYLHNSSFLRDSIQKKYNIPSNCTILGYVGRLSEEWKRVDFLISCFSSILKKDKKFHLLIVGLCDSEYCNFLKRITHDLGIENYVSFVGFIPDPLPIMNFIDILIAPSREEPFGRTLLESMSQKTIVIASKSGGHREIISDNNGLFFNLDDCNDLEEKIKYVKRNTDSVNKIIENAYEYVINNFSSSIHMEKVIGLYRSIN
jgi:glycosyltransferase involved in cell wall biosynthesis